MSPKAASPQKKRNVKPVVKSSSSPRGRKAAAPDLVELAEKCSCIISAISGASKDQVLPQSTVQTLTACAKPSLQALKDERHEFQTAMVEMIGDALQSIEEDVLSRIEELQAKVDASDEARAERSGALAAAELCLAEAASFTGEKQAAVGEAYKALSAAEKAVRQLEAAKEACGAEIEQATKRKRKLQDELQNVLAPLKEGRRVRVDMRLTKVGKKYEKPLQKRLGTVGREYGLEKSMVAALRVAIKNAVASRGPFDNLAIDEFERLCVKKVEDFTLQAEDSSLRLQERSTELEAAKTVVVVAREAKDAAKASLKKARRAQAKAEEAVASAKGHLKGFVPEMKSVCTQLDRKRCKLETFRSGAKAAFEDLRDRDTAAVEEARLAALAAKAAAKAAREAKKAAKLAAEEARKATRREKIAKTKARKAEQEAAEAAEARTRRRVATEFPSPGVPPAFAASERGTPPAGGILSERGTPIAAAAFSGSPGTGAFNSPATVSPAMPEEAFEEFRRAAMSAAASTGLP